GLCWNIGFSPFSWNANTEWSDRFDVRGVGSGRGCGGSSHLLGAARRKTAGGREAMRFIARARSAGGARRGRGPSSREGTDASTLRDGVKTFRGSGGRRGSFGPPRGRYVAAGPSASFPPCCDWIPQPPRTT